MKRLRTSTTASSSSSSFSSSSKKSLDRISLERVTRWLHREWRTVWKIVLALFALADLLGCFPVAREGWNSYHSKDEQGFSFSPDVLFKKKDDTCAPYSRLLYLFTWIGPVFCVLCIGEAALRAQQARNETLEMQALDNFEKKLARFYTSTRRIPPTTNIPQEEDYSYDQDDLWARNTLRFWTPVLSTLCAWALLMPWPTLLATSQCGTDTALATVWITQLLQFLSTAQKIIWDQIVEWAWQLALPLHYWVQPHKLYKRIRVLLRWVRYFRFAGPLFRMSLKLSDQAVVFWKTRSQGWRAHAEKAKRMVRRSMLFEDIHRIESLTKLQTRLARVPTHMVSLAKEQAEGIGNLLAQKQRDGRQMMHKLAELKAQVRRNSTVFPSSEIYDRIVDLNQELTATVCSTLWSANLISPQTRFSVVWRMVVTFALLSELTRICTSYQLYGNVDVSYPAMMMSLLGCDHNLKHGILTQTGRWTRKLVRKLHRLPPEQLLTSCTKLSLRAHPMANFGLVFSSTFETAIDIVCFLDIFVWFFTGEIDVDGRVIPKSFVYRCILPGTLVQVLDHPTLPDMLPNLMAYAMSAAGAVGYSRVIRWMVTMVPAIDLVLVHPIHMYWFRPMDSAEWMRYTESLAIFPAISGADLRYAVSHPNLRAAAQPSVRHHPMSPPVTRTKKRMPTSFLPTFPSSTRFSTREDSSGGLFIDGSIHMSSVRRAPSEREVSGFYIDAGMDDSFVQRPSDVGRLDDDAFQRHVRDSAEMDDSSLRRVSFDISPKDSWTTISPNDGWTDKNRETVIS